MEIIDDFGVITFLGKILTITIKFFSFFKKSLPELIFDGGMNVNMVNSDAGLSRIKKFSK